MKHLENKVTKSSKGKGKGNVKKNIKAKAGKKDKKEEINKIIKKENELTTNELTVFEENNEVIIHISKTKSGVSEYPEPKKSLKILNLVSVA